MWLEWSEGREEEEMGLEWWPGSSPAHGNKFCFQGIWLTFSQWNRHCWCSAHIPLISHVYLLLSCQGHCFLRLTVAPFSGTGGLLPERYCSHPWGHPTANDCFNSFASRWVQPAAARAPWEAGESQTPAETRALLGHIPSCTLSCSLPSPQRIPQLRNCFQGT